MTHGVKRQNKICFRASWRHTNRFGAWKKGLRTLAWTKNPKLWVGWSLMVANDVSIPRECFAKISEFLKRNWPRAAHV